MDSCTNNQRPLVRQRSRSFSNTTPSEPPFVRPRSKSLSPNFRVAVHEAPEPVETIEISRTPRSPIWPLVGRSRKTTLPGRIEDLLQQVRLGPSRMLLATSCDASLTKAAPESRVRNDAFDAAQVVTTPWPGLDAAYIYEMANTSGYGSDGEYEASIAGSDDAVVLAELGWPVWSRYVENSKHQVNAGDARDEAEAEATSPWPRTRMEAR